MDYVGIDWSYRRAAWCALSNAGKVVGEGAVAADGPQTPGRVQLNKAMVGFLTHTGYSHGGNGFEGMAFLLEQFKDADLKEPTDRSHGLDLKAMAHPHS